MGNKKLTLDEFVEKAKDYHNNKYDYSKSVYVNSETKMIIICPIHGDTLQTPYSHLRGCGCAKCSFTQRSNKTKGRNNHWVKPMSKEDFINKATKIWGDLYTYEKVVYINNKTKVIVTCPIKGDFLITPNHLLRSHPPKSVDINKYKNYFINKANKVHKNFYVYDKVEYINSQTKVKIVCPIHGEFLQRPYSHLSGGGCTQCSRKISSTKRTKTTEEFIRQSTDVHGNKFDYSNLKYVNSLTKVVITCREHGDFLQTPTDHLRGAGCPKCYLKLTKENWCTKLSKGSDATIYVAIFNKGNDSFVKVGITLKTLKKRFSGKKLSGDYIISCLYHYQTDDREFIWDLECDVKDKFKDFLHRPHTYFGGAMTECFELDYKDSIISYLKSKIE